MEPQHSHNLMERDELIEKFTKHEVETAEELLSCVDGPVTAYNFRRLMLLFLRGHYSSSNNYMGFDQLNCYFWHPDAKETKLEVAMTHSDDDRNPDAYPGVYVGFGSMELANLGIGGNFAGHSQDLSGTHVSKESTVTLQVHHVAKNAQDAWDLAELSARALQAMGHPLARNAGATGFEVLGLQTPRKKNPSPEKHYTVATPVQIKYTQSVTRSQESHRVRQIIQLIATES